jgi:hypothetical protein
MNKLLVVVAAIVSAALTLGPSPASATHPTRIRGGGVATFDDITGLSAYFGMDATVLGGKDEAYGEFTSVTVDYAVVIGSFTSGKINDDGSVTLAGTASTFYLDGHTVVDFPYNLTVWPGAPKAGRFLMRTPDNGDGDYQTLSVGTLEIVTP